MIRAAGCTLKVGATGLTLTDRALGCTLMVGAARHGLVGAEGVLGLCTSDSRYVLAAQALLLRTALHAHCSGFALTIIK
jgi:hypothetical protein